MKRLNGRLIAYGCLGLTAIAAPQAAEAACNTSGNNVNCTNATAGNQTFAPTGNGWNYNLHATPTPPASINGSVTINNTGGLGNYNGTFTMDEGTSIAPAANVNALTINGTTALGFVTLNIDGSIINHDALNQNFDALRLVNGWNYEVNIGTAGVLVGNDDALVVTAIANNVTVNNEGTLTARGQAGGANGGEAIIIAQGGTQDAKVAGSATIHNTGTLESLGTTLGGQAIHAAAVGALTVTNDYRYEDDERVEDTGRILGGTEGMRLVSGTSVTVTNKAYIQAASGDGVQAVVDGTTGGIKIDNDVSEDGTEGTIKVLAAGASGGDAIDARIANVGNDESIAITNKGHIESIAGAGIVASTTGTGGISIGNLSTNSIVSLLDGIDATSTTGEIAISNGDGSVENPDGKITAGQIGINALATAGGPITIYNGNASVSNSSITAGGEYGILAQSLAGGANESGQVTVYNSGSVTVSSPTALAAVREVASGTTPNGYAYFDNGAFGTSNNAYGARINAYDPENPGAGDANGVELQKIDGTGGIQIGSSDFVYGAVFYNEGGWDFTAHPAGNYLTDVADGGGVYAPNGTAVSIVHTGAESSKTLFFNSGTIIGQGNAFDPVVRIETTYNPAAVAVPTEPDQPYQVVMTNTTNSSGVVGVIASSALPSFFVMPTGAALVANEVNLAAFRPASNDNLLEATGAPVRLDNSALLVGRLTFNTEQSNTLHNFAGGVWLTRGTSRFYGGDADILTNHAGGIIQTAFGAEPDVTSFRGLNQFTNGGLLNMIDGGLGDRTFTSGNYTGGYNGVDGRLGVDAYLGAPGSTADRFLIGGDSSGKTGIIVNDLNAGPGYYNPTGIQVVHVDGTTSAPENFKQTSPPGNFYLPNGPIDKGFFSYDLYRREEQSVGWYLASVPNARAFELPQLATAAQTIWHETSVWLDRTADLRRTADCAVTPYGVAPKAQGGEGACYQGLFGTWARAFGGDFDRSATNSASVFGTPSTFNSNYSQNLWGFEGGADMMVLRPSSGDGVLWLGALAGFVSSDVQFDTSYDKAEFSGATVGVYATYVNGPLYADLAFKADLLDVDYKTTFGGASANTNSNTYGLRFDTGYRFSLAQGFFIDPEGTLAWANTNVDNISLLAANANFGSQDSFRGRLGGRIGASWAGAGGIFEPFAEASVWHEFEGDNGAALASGPLVLALTDSIDDTWGEVGGGINWFNDSGASVFFKGDALVGGDLTGFNLRGGGRIGW